MTKAFVVCFFLFLNTPVFASKSLAPFFSPRPSTEIRLSPNGNVYLQVMVSGENDNISTKLSSYDSQTLAIQNTIDLANFFDANTVLRELKWLDNQHVAAVLIDKEEIESTLFERNAQLRLVIIDVTAPTDKPLIYEVSTAGRLIEAAPTQEGVFYFARNGRNSKVYKIEIAKLLKLGQKRSKLTRVDGGQFIAKNVVAETEGFAFRWFFESSGKPVAVAFYTLEGKMQLATFENDDSDQTSSKLITKPLKTWEKDELETEFKDQENNKKKLYLPIAKTSKSNAFYTIDYHEKEALSLYLSDYETGKSELIYSSPGLPIKDIIFSKENEAIGVVVVEEGLYTEQYFDGQPTKNNSDMLEVVADESADGKIQLIYRESHNMAGQYLLKTGDHLSQTILTEYPDLPGTLPSRQIKGEVKVGELDIPYLLSLPPKASVNTPAPIILLPHGGPFYVFDTPYFDPIAQYFVANGYAVLRVNFRGSSGYGVAHREAGKKQWGVGMLNDLTEAFKQVIQRDDINANRACTVGMSYGGYASLMLNIQSPRLFKCAVSVAGVTDVNLFLKQAYISKVQSKWLKENVGDTHLDFTHLIEISPLYQLHKLTNPLLLIHGAKDERVSVEHAFRAKLILEKSNIPFTWEYFEDADHHFAENDQRIRLFNSIIHFVDTHLKVKN